MLAHTSQRVTTNHSVLLSELKEDGIVCCQKWTINGRLLAQLHGNFTPAHADGCAAQCFEGVQRGSLIILSVHPRPQAATPVSRPGFVAHLFGRGPVLRTCNRVMAHRPTGSTQTDRIRLPYAARRLSLSRWGWEAVSKGVHTACPESVQIKSQNRNDEFRFQPLA